MEQQIFSKKLTEPVCGNCGEDDEEKLLDPTPEDVVVGRCRLTTGWPRVAQVDLAWFQRVDLLCDEALSNFAFQSTLRRCAKEFSMVAPQCTDCRQNPRIKQVHGNRRPNAATKEARAEKAAKKARYAAAGAGAGAEADADADAAGRHGPI